MEQFDVVISGYGPTGQASASLLSRMGHRVCVIERWPSLYGLPRLCTIDGETARIVQAAGDVDEALRDSHQLKRTLLLNEDHELILKMDHDRYSVSGYPSHISMYQPHIEDAMDAAAREHGATVYQGWEVQSWTQDDDIVTIQVHKTESDDPAESMTIQARYLIGADGARSIVRESAGIERDGSEFRSAWICVDAIRKRVLPKFWGLSEDMRESVIMAAPEGRAFAVIPIGDRRLRFEFYADPESTHDERMSFDAGYEVLERVHGLTRDDVEIYRTVMFPFQSRLARSWQSGRVLLAGDAAHTMTPFLAQGACSGLRDAINLSWKLDLVLRGVSDPALLKTYFTERFPQVEEVVTVSEQIGRWAMELDSEKARQRDRDLLEGSVLPPPPPAADIDEGVLLNEGTEPVVGQLAPQGRVSFEGREGRFDDVVGWGFQLIMRDVDVAVSLSDDDRAFLETIRCTIVGVGEVAGPGIARDLDGAYAAFLSEHRIAGFLARPDFYVFAAVHDATDVQAVVSQLRIQLSASRDQASAGTVPVG